jgi:hypothetical protein
MNRYWVIIKDERGYPMRVELREDNPFRAFQLAKALYGTRLISENANQF